MTEFLQLFSRISFKMEERLPRQPFSINIKATQGNRIPTGVADSSVIGVTLIMVGRLSFAFGGDADYAL